MSAVNPQQEQEAPPQTTDDLLRAILTEQQSYRDQIATLKQQIADTKPAAPVAVPAVNLSAEDMLAARMQEIGKHDYYCPGCGLLYDYPQRCSGRAESGHAPIEVKSTDELKSGDPSQHSAMEYAIR